jgi:SH3 domain-containing YSC84-like protein 1
MRAATGAIVIAAMLAAPTNGFASLSSKEVDRIHDAAAVLREMHGMPDTDIPQSLWDKSKCVIVIPSLKKAAFVVGGEYGAGLMSCRHGDTWSAPVFMQLGKGSWGLQIGAQSIDLVLLVMNDRGAEKLLRDKVSLGAEASVAAGPVGRNAAAATDAQMRAEILSYSRTQGVFAGIDLSGGVLKPDNDDNRDLYGENVSARQVVMDGTMKAPRETRPFLSALHRESAAANRRT